MANDNLTFFIAHAGADIDVAERIHHDLTEAGVPCFLDRVDLLPGDRWDLLLPAAQRRARATIVLVSSRYEQAYYLNEEVASAIEQHRAGTHRVVPVYLDDMGDLTPYGLRVANALFLHKVGVEEVIRQLLRLASALGDEVSVPPAAALPRRTYGNVERRQLFDALCEIQNGSSYFDQLLEFEVPKAKHEIPQGPAVTAAHRAMTLVQWAYQQGDPVVQQIWDYVKEKAPATLP